MSGSNTVFENLDSLVCILLRLVACLSRVATALGGPAVKQAHGCYSKGKKKLWGVS